MLDREKRIGPIRTGDDDPVSQVLNRIARPVAGEHGGVVSRLAIDDVVGGIAPDRVVAAPAGRILDDHAVRDGEATKNALHFRNGSSRNRIADIRATRDARSIVAFFFPS